MNATTTWASVKGTQVRVGDARLLGYTGTATVVSVTQGQLTTGARYADVVLSNGETERCWDGFMYRVGR